MFYKRLFALWMSMMVFFIVDDEGIGEGDFLIDDEFEEPEIPDEVIEEAGKKEKPAEEDKPKDDETAERLSELEAFKQEADIKKAIDSAVEGIQSEYKEFDIEKVAGFLKEMHKKDPEKAESYNTPAGWEAIWLKNFAKSDEEGTFDPGRNNAEEPFEFDKVQKTALGGDKRAMKLLFENAK